MKNLADAQASGDVNKTDMAQATRYLDACDSASTPYEEALAAILRNIEPIDETERLSIRQALHRVAAEDIRATQNVPTNRNSAMDGYACRYADLARKGESSALALAGASAAGSPYSGALNKGDCIRILTGGVVPDELDTVIMQEDCAVDGGLISTVNTHRIGQHIREAGEDIATGEIAVSTGQRIGIAELGLLASVGCGDILVRRKPKVAFFSTGDELKGIEETLNPGDVYDSNRYTLYGLLKKAQVEPIDLGVVRDDFDETVASLKEGAALADVIVTSAGASVGDADFVKQALESLGELTLWKVAMKPGRPLAFGKIGKTWFFGLPGNPVSVMVTFDKFVKPALHKLRGESSSTALRLTARSLKPIFKTPGRLEFQRGVLSFTPTGEAIVHSTGNQSSGVLTSMSLANCYIVLPLETGNLEAGAEVTVEPFTIEF